MIKIHPPHQLLFPNDYLSGAKELEIIYRAAEANGVPVMFHTGTSIFPGARNKYGDPIYVDDVAVDFPKLKILLAHGGRPLWMQTAFFLVRRHPNVYLDISGIPPKTLLKYFPRLEEIAHKTLFGTDWPGPGVPDIKKNLEEFRALPLSESVQQQILSKTALTHLAGLTDRAEKGPPVQGGPDDSRNLRIKILLSGLPPRQPSFPSTHPPRRSRHRSYARFPGCLANPRKRRVPAYRCKRSSRAATRYCRRK